MVTTAASPSDAGTKIPASLRTLLAGLIDYAGTFPPARLSLADSVRRYLSYAAGPHAWMLGRLVASADDLPEVDRLLGTLSPSRTWPATVTAAGVEQLEALSGCTPERLRIASVELRQTTAEVVRAASRRIGAGREIYVEVALDDQLADTLAALRDAGWRAKVRTGGVTTDVFPSVAALAGFMRVCRNHGVAFKATAGLHHPIRGEYPLTYDAEPPRGTMHGFINLFIAAALCDSGQPEGDVRLALEDTEAGHFAFTSDAATWQGHRIPTGALRRVREQVAISFGSCSFDEPLRDLRALGLL